MPRSTRTARPNLFNIELKPEAKQLLARMAQDAGLTMSSMIRQLLFAGHRRPTHRKRLATHPTGVARSEPRSDQ